MFNNESLSRPYAECVGPKEYFDLLGFHQLEVLVTMGLRENHTVLDIGAGVYRAGRFIQRYAPKYYAVEPNPLLVEKADKDTHPVMLCRRLDFDFSEFGIRFDYILCHAVMTHMSKPQLLGCLEGISKALKSNGMGLATIGITAGAEYTGKSWHGKIAHYHESTITKLGNKAGLRVKFLGIAHPKGQRWALLTMI